MPVAAFLDAYPEGNVAYIRLARNGRVGEFFAPYGALTNNPARTEAAHEALMLAVKRATDAGVKPSDVDE
jgi:ribonuclease HI